MARTNDTRARVRALAEEFSARGEEPSPTVILRILGRGSASTVVDELRRWREETAKPSEAPVALSHQSDAVSASPIDEALPRVAELLEPLTEAISRLTQRLDEQERSYAAQLALAYDRFTAVQKMAMVAIDEAREQTRFWKQEAERAKLESSAQVDTYRDAMRSAQGEARRLAELLEVHQATARPQQTDRMRIPPAPTLAGIGSAPASAVTPTLRETAVSRQYDPDGRAEE